MPDIKLQNADGSYSTYLNKTSITLPTPSGETVDFKYDDGESDFNKLARRTITEVTAEMLNGVTKIRRYLFDQCYYLATIALPNDITEIGDYAFADCERLPQITIPDTVTTIGKLAFSGCVGMNVNLVLPTCNIGEAAFQICGITGLNFSSTGKTYVRFGAFGYCTRLDNLVIPANVTFVRNSDNLGRHFYSCTGLTNVVADGELSEGIFYNCTSLMSLTLRQDSYPVTYNTNMLYGVPQDCAIYVPAHLVSQYKTTSGWSSRAAYIQAIQE